MPRTHDAAQIASTRRLAGLGGDPSGALRGGARVFRPRLDAAAVASVRHLISICCDRVEPLIGGRVPQALAQAEEAVEAAQDHHTRHGGIRSGPTAPRSPAAAGSARRGAFEAAEQVAYRS